MTSADRSITGDNLAILLTPPGSAAIAVVRLIGPGVRKFLTGYFSRKPVESKPVHGLLSDGGRTIDDPVVVLLPDSAGVDISLHGGPWVVRSMLQLARREGFSLIHEKGLAVADAMSDAHSRIEQEVLADIGLARTELGLRILLAQIQAWDKLTHSPRSREQIDRILADRSLYWLLHPPAVAIVGAANVGKSTLANQLFGQERSITADLPGTTRDWVGAIANIDGLPIMLVDTPGQRTTDDPIEQSAINRSQIPIASAQLIILVLDATRPLDPEQQRLLDTYPSALKVANKVDQPAAWNVEKFPAVLTVANTGVGVALLRAAIATHFGCQNLDPNQPRCWTERQAEMLARL